MCEPMCLAYPYNKSLKSWIMVTRRELEMQRPINKTIMESTLAVKALSLLAARESQAAVPRGAITNDPRSPSNLGRQKSLGRLKLVSSFANNLLVYKTNNFSNLHHVFGYE